MTWTSIGLLVGAVVGAVCWSAMCGALDVEQLRRSNYRGATVVTGAGVVIPVTVVLVVALARVVVAADDAVVSWDRLTAATLVAVLGFAVFGLLDDVIGGGQSGGFAGHVAALRQGIVTTGMVKLVGGAAVGLLTASLLQRGDDTAVGLLRDGATIALAANVGNLFDRAPGRATKLTAIIFVATASLARDPALLMPAIAVGAGLGLLVPDLRERLMLGDTGANVLGAMCGIAAVQAVDGTVGRWLLLALTAGLNGLSEVVSFSRVIDAVGPLRWLDRLGSSGERTGRS